MHIRLSHLLSLVLGLLVCGGEAAFSQTVEKVSFLGPDCTAANSSSEGVSSIDNLELAFQDFALTQSSNVMQLNSAHCKIEILTKFAEGYGLRLKGMDVYLSGNGAQGFDGVIQSTLFDGQRMRFSSPMLTKVESQRLPKKVHIKRIGIGKSAIYCDGDTVPYQITLFLKAQNTGVVREPSMGEIRINAIDNIEFEKVKCKSKGE